MGTFIETHLFEIISLGILVGSGLLIVGYYKYQIEDLKERVREMEHSGSSFARESLGQLNQKQTWHEQRLTEVEQEHSILSKTLNEMYTSVKVIEAYIKNTHKDK